MSAMTSRPGRLPCAVAICIILSAPARTSAQSPPSLERRLDMLAGRLEAARTEEHIPGMAIAVVKEGEVVLTRGFGYKDVEAKEPATPETIFAIGSSTKAFTATLAGMLVDEGKLSWDDPVTKVLPELVLKVDREGAKLPADTPVTIRDFLCHRTGYTRMDLAWAGGKASRAEILATLTRAKPVSPFRKDFHYNNLGFLVSGMIAAKAAGAESWEALVRERLLDPLGMKGASLSVTVALEDPRTAKGYRWESEEEGWKHLPMRNIDSVGPAGSINANVLDMSRWVLFQLGRGEIDGKRLIAEKTLEETWAKQIEMGDGGDYGLGWMLRKWRDKKVVEHGGNIDGFSATVAFIPEERVGFVLLSNVTHSALQRSSIDLVFDTLLGDPEAESKELARSEDFAPFIGKYVADFGPFKDARFAVTAKDGKLYIDVPGQMNYALKPAKEDGRRPFALTDAIAVRFVGDSAGGEGAATPAQKLLMYQAGFEFECLREGVEPPIEVPLEELKKYLGSYRSEKQKADLTVRIKNNRLAMDVPGQMAYELLPPDEEGKRGIRIKPSEIQVRFDEKDGKVESLTIFQKGEETCSRVADAPPSALPKIDEIIAKVRGSYGPAGAAFKPGDTLEIVSKATFAEQGIEGTQDELIRGFDEQRSMVDLGVYGKILTVHGAKGGYIEALARPAERMDAKEHGKAVLWHPLRNLADWHADYPSLTVLREGKVGEEPTWVVKRVPKEGPDSTVYISMKSGDVLKIEAAEDLKGLGKLPVTITHEDYRDYDGLRLPRKTTVHNAITGDCVLEVESVVRGAKVGEEAFDVPEGVK